MQRRPDTTAIIVANKGAFGEVFVDTTINGLVVQDGATNGGWHAPVTLFVGNGGSTNNSSSGSGAFVDHTQTFTIPANVMTSGRAFRVTAHLQITTGSAAPVLTHRIKLGTTVIGANGGGAPANNLTNVGIVLQWIFQSTQAPGAAASVQCSLTTVPSGPTNTVNMNTIAMPVAVATTSSQAVTIGTQWTTAGTGTNTIALNQLIVEALN